MLLKCRCTCINFEITPTILYSGYMTCPFNLLDLINLTVLGERYKLWSSLLWSLLHSPFSSLLGLNIRFGILISNTLSLRSSLNVRDHASLKIKNFIYQYITRMQETFWKMLQFSWYGPIRKKRTHFLNNFCGKPHRKLLFVVSWDADCMKSMGVNCIYLQRF